MTVFIEISFVSINSFVQSLVNSFSYKSSSICNIILTDEVSKEEENS